MSSGDPAGGNRTAVGRLTVSTMNESYSAAPPRLSLRRNARDAGRIIPIGR